jgi:hypothetical protein
MTKGAGRLARIERRGAQSDSQVIDEEVLYLRGRRPHADPAIANRANLWLQEKSVYPTGDSKVTCRRAGFRGAPCIAVVADDVLDGFNELILGLTIRSASVMELLKSGEVSASVLSSTMTGKMKQWRRGESNPCFQRRRPGRSRTGLIREDSETVSKLRTFPIGRVIAYIWSFKTSSRPYALCSDAQQSQFRSSVQKTNNGVRKATRHPRRKQKPKLGCARWINFRGYPLPWLSLFGSLKFSMQLTPKFPPVHGGKRCSAQTICTSC